MPNYTEPELKFLNLIYAARKVAFDINKIELKTRREKEDINCY